MVSLLYRPWMCLTLSEAPLRNLNQVIQCLLIVLSSFLGFLVIAKSLSKNWFQPWHSRAAAQGARSPSASAPECSDTDGKLASEAEELERLLLSTTISGLDCLDVRMLVLVLLLLPLGPLAVLMVLVLSLLLPPLLLLLLLLLSLLLFVPKMLSRLARWPVLGGVFLLPLRPLPLLLLLLPSPEKALLRYSRCAPDIISRTGTPRPPSSDDPDVNHIGSSSVHRSVVTRPSLLRRACVKPSPWPLPLKGGVGDTTDAVLFRLSPPVVLRALAMLIEPSMLRCSELARVDRSRSLS